MWGFVLVDILGIDMHPPGNRHSPNWFPTDEKKFVSAAEKGDFVTIAGMLQAGMHPDTKDRVMRPALTGAAQSGQFDIVALLLDAGANPNIHDKHGYVPLHRAVMYNHTHVVRQLLDAGANPTIVSHDGEGIAELAQKYSNIRRNQASIDIIAQYAQFPELPAHFCKADLFKANPETGYAPLDNPATWHRLDDIFNNLRANGEELVLNDLLATNHEGKTWLQRGVECRRFPDLISYFNARGELLQADHLLIEGKTASPLLQSVEQTRTVDFLFTLSNWLGQSQVDITRCFHAMSDYGKAQVSNYHALYHVVERAEQSAQRGRS